MSVRLLLSSLELVKVLGGTHWNPRISVEVIASLKGDLSSSLRKLSKMIANSRDVWQTSEIYFETQQKILNNLCIGVFF